MSEQERRWTRDDDGEQFRYFNGEMQRNYGDDYWLSTAYELKDMEGFGRTTFTETFAHLPAEQQPNPQPDELTALRTFRETVVTAAQFTPNHRLPQEIFAADDAVRKAVNQREVADVERS
jgi:hypothetical protein